MTIHHSAKIPKWIFERDFKMITQAELKELLNYDVDTGIFTWKIKYCRKVKVGSVVGSPDKDGYIRVRINGKDYKCHRLAWMYVYNNFPVGKLDHINGIKNDNRICNLRLANNEQNAFNAKLRTDNTSGFKNVCWNRTFKKWQVSLSINKKQTTIGYFDDIELADLVATEARNKHHKEFVRHF
jgi:hypothetical protein